MDVERDQAAADGHARVLLGNGPYLMGYLPRDVVSNVVGAIGGSGDDTLVGPADDATWSVTGMNAGADRARSNLEAAAGLSVTGNTVKVVNLTSHKLISGYPEGRRMWLNIQWFDANGSPIREDGAYGDVSLELVALLDRAFAEQEDLAVSA